jgi:hypothetical protein
MDSARFGIVGTVNQAFHAAVDHCASTHGARLNCNKQFAPFKPMISNRRPGCAKRHDLRMGSRIAISDITVSTAACNFASAHYHRPNWHLSRLKRALRGAESLFHKEFVGC